MTEQLVAPPRTSARAGAAWVLAGVGVVVAVVEYGCMLMGLVFSVGLSEPPPRGAGDWIQVSVVLLAFAGLPLLAAFAMARSMRSSLGGRLLVAAVAWTVPLVSLLCFGAYWALWGLLAGG